MSDWPAAVQRGEPASHYDALPAADLPQPAEDDGPKATVTSSIFSE